MEPFAKFLGAVLIGIIIISFAINIVDLVLRIYNYFIDKKITKEKRKQALLTLKNLKLAYDNLMLCRTNYHKIKYIEDPEKRATMQKELKTLYQQQLETLSGFDDVSNKEYLTDKEIAEFEEILARPRYELI